MRRSYITLLLTLIATGAAAQTTNCFVELGGLVRCAQPGKGPIPSPVVNCMAYGSAFMSCSHPQGLQPPPATIAPSYPNIQTVPFPSIRNSPATTFFQQQQEQAQAAQRSFERNYRELQQQEYEQRQLEFEQQELDIQRQALLREDANNKMSNALSNPKTDSSINNMHDNNTLNARSNVLRANFCSGYEIAMLHEMHSRIHKTDKYYNVEESFLEHQNDISADISLYILFHGDNVDYKSSQDAFRHGKLSYEEDLRANASLHNDAEICNNLPFVKKVITK